MLSVLRYLSLILVFVSVVPVAQAASELRIPRFVTVKAKEANVRTGPSVRYPVLWVYKRSGLPVEILAEFEQWRKIRDKDGDEGWIHKSLLSGKRSVFLTGQKEHVVYRLPDPASLPLLRAESGVMGSVLSCEKQWCRINIDGEKGWLERQFLWGVYPDEVMN